MDTESRIARLERSLSIFRVLTVLSLIGLGLLGSAFLLQMVWSRSGEIAVGLTDEGGLIEAESAPVGAVLGVKGLDNKPKASLFYLPDRRTSGLRLTDETGRHRLDLVTEGDAGAYLGMKNIDQRPRVRLTVFGKEQTSSLLEFLDNDDQPRLRIGVSREGEPYLSFLDPEGEIVAAYP